MKRLFVYSMLIGCCFLLLEQSSRAQVTTFTLSGHVTSFFDPGGNLSPQVSPGDSLTGTVILDTNLPGDQFRGFPDDIGIFLHLPGVNFTWFALGYDPTHANVQGFHRVGFSNWNAVDIGSNLFLKTGGSWRIDGLEGNTGDNWEVKGVVDSITPDLFSTVPEGNSYILLGAGFLVPGLALLYQRRRRR